MAKKKLSDLTGQQVVQYYDPSAPSAGIIQPYMGSVVPSGWLLCDGQEVSQSVYATLFAVLSTTYNTQINPTTGSAWAAPTAGNFRVPDMRGVTPRGVGTPVNGSALALGDYQADQFQGHRHNSLGEPFALTDQTLKAAVVGSGGWYTPSSLNSQTGSPASDGTNGTPRTGTETRGKARGVNWIIKCFNPTMVSYNGGMAGPLLSGMVKPRKGQVDLVCTSANWTTARAKGIYYQDQDGAHRFKFNISGSFAGAANNNFVQISVTGITTVNFIQAVACHNSNVQSVGCANARLDNNTNTLSAYLAAVVAVNATWAFSGDVELASRPSWA